MQSFVSLWSADLLDVGHAIDLTESEADGFHIDVMDGHYVSGLLFGPDFVRAVCQRTTRPVEVHLMVTDPDRWIEPFADAGCARMAVHSDSTPDIFKTLKAIERHGTRPGLGLTVDQPPEVVEPYLELVDRILVMGTVLGIKGVDPDPHACDRVTRIAGLRDHSRRLPEVFVDGGIRKHSVPNLADAGADGVIPGSLVFGDPDPASMLSWIKSLGPAAQAVQS